MKNDKPMKKKAYVMPAVTVVEFRSEQGFAASGAGGVDLVDLLFFQDGSQETESFSSHGTWTEGSNGFWE